MKMDFKKMDFKQILLILAVIVISFVFYLQFRAGRGLREGGMFDTPKSDSNSGSDKKSSSGMFSGLKDGAKDAGSSAVDGAKDVGSSAVDGAKDAASSAKDVGSGAKDAGSGAKDVGSGANAPVTTQTASSSRSTLTNEHPELCNSDYRESKNLPLREYYIKSSFNTAFDGNDVSCSTIIARLAEGYRFIDFNVFSASGDVFVGFSKGNTPSLDMNSGKLRFSEALECIAKNAFTSPESTDTPPNQVKWSYAELPIFVNLRVFRAPGSTIDIISNIANIINPNSGSTTAGAVSQPSYSMFYYLDPATNMPKKVDSCTPLSDLSKKIIFTMNIENVLEVYTPSAEYASQVPDATIAAMNSFANFLTGGHTCPAYYNYTDAIQSLTSRTNVLMKNDDDLKSYRTNIRHMIIVFPHPKDTENQPDIRKFAINCSALILPMRTYLADNGKNLALTTSIFDQHKSGFVPAVKLAGYINNFDNPTKLQ